MGSRPSSIRGAPDAATASADVLQSGSGSAVRLLRTDSRRTRARILEHAFEVLSERPEASIGDIAAAAQVNRATIHRHFSQREDLVAALADTICQQLDQVHLEARAEGGSAHEQIERMLQHILRLGPRFRFFLAHWPSLMDGELFQTTHSWAELLVEARRDGVISEALTDEWIGRFVGITLGLAIELQSEGKLSNDEAVEFATHTIMRGIGHA